jgi:hypothetical protein
MDIFIEAPNLLRRYQKGDAFRRYVDDRAMLIIPVAALFLVFSLATTAGTVVTLGGTHSFLVLLMLIAAPFLLAGTFLVLVFVFFSWLEARSLARMLARVKKPAAKPGLRALRDELPRIPWVLVGLFVLAPLLLLAELTLAGAALMLVLALAAPAAYAWLDR